MRRFNASDNVARILVFVMFFFSSALIAWLLYVILTKSPEAMRRYKYMIVILTLSMYQFDVVQTLICPTALDHMPGLQFTGILGYFLQEKGNLLVVVYCSSVMILGMTIVINFVWREYAIVPFKFTPLSIFLHSIHFLIVTASLAGVFYFCNRMMVDYWLVRHILDDIIHSNYDPNLAIFGVILANSKECNQFYEYLVYCILITGTYVLKAIFRITFVMRKGGNRFSANTLKMHKMLLRALIFQTLAPIIIIALPFALIILVGVFSQEVVDYLGPEEVLTKSPAAMKRYKYMIVVLSFSVYQFDVIHTLLNPTALPRMAGVHFSGILGYNYPQSGNTLFLVYCISLMINGLSLTVSFVWREFAIIKFKFTFLSILFHLIHLLIVVASFVGFFFVFHKTLPDVSVVKAELDKMSSYYHPHFALFGWLNYDDFYFFFEYVLFLYFVGCTIGIKSIIRISIVMYRRENKYGNSRRLNENALRVHKMLFRALLFETMAPIIVFVIPMTILIMIHLCLGRLFNYFGGVEEDKPGKMIPFEFEANPSRILVFVLFFLSTILYIWLLYIILYKSPPCMARYKYVIMFLSFSVYQFDVIQTLLCPTAIHKMAGAQFSGILGYLFPESGNTLFLIYCTSIMLNGIALAFNFVWREFAINTFKPNCLPIFLHFLHYLAVVCCLAGFYVVSYKTIGTAEQWEMRRHLNSCGSSYNPNYALFGWIPAKIDDFYTFFKYVLFCYLFTHTIVLKSVIRISIAIYRRKNNYVASRRLNESSLRVHKMLFRALLFEALTPLIPFVIPITMIIVVHLFCEYWEAHSGGYAQAEAFVLNLVAMALMLPSFFSIIHVFTVIWFTTPYKNYVKQKTTSALKLITGK